MQDQPTPACDWCQAPERTWGKFCSRACSVRYALSHRAYTRTPLADRFWKYVDAGHPDDCWEWQGARDHHGYGRLHAPGRTNKILKAHRVSVEVHGTEIPPGQIVRHACDNPPCVNPAHLLTGTMKDNSRDMYERGRDGRTYGDERPSTVIPDAVVRQIREDAATGKGCKELALAYGLTLTYTSALILGRRRQAAGGPIQPTRTRSQVQYDRWRKAREAA